MLAHWQRKTETSSSKSLGSKQEENPARSSILYLPSIVAEINRCQTA